MACKIIILYSKGKEKTKKKEPRKKRKVKNANEGSRHSSTDIKGLFNNDIMVGAIMTYVRAAHVYIRSVIMTWGVQNGQIYPDAIIKQPLTIFTHR